MARISAEEKKLVDVIKRLPFEDDDKNRWADSINSAGLSEETIKEIQAKTADLPKPDETQAVNRKRDTAAITTLVRRWRLGQNLRKLR